MQNKFKYFLKILFLSIFLSVLTGCGGSGAQIQVPKQHIENQKPSWVDGVLPNDTDRYMYGMGIGSDRQNAIHLALNDMISKLGTTIESTYESDEVVVNNSYVNSTVKNKIKAEISKIKINNYKVIKSYRINYREFAVMVQSDKIKFVNGLKESLKQQEKELNQKSLTLKDSDILTRYNNKKELASKAKKLLYSVLIISQLDPTFDKKKALNYISKKQEESIQESKNLKFYVTGDKNTLTFVDKIKNYLAQNGYKVINYKQGAVQIKLHLKEYIKSSIAVLTLDVRILDKSNRIGGKSIVMKERYNGSKQSVYKNATIHFEQDMNSLGINDFIGLNLKKD